MHAKTEMLVNHLYSHDIFSKQIWTPC